MGDRGPVPMPTALLERRGSWRAKLNKKEPQPERGRPRCPSYLSSSAKCLWKRLIPLLENIGVLTKVDEFVLGRYCQMFSRWKKAQEFIDKHGEVMPIKNVSGETVDMKLFPQVLIADKLSDRLLKIEQCFGLSPSARARLEVGRADKGVSKGKDRFFKPRIAKSG